MRCIAHSPSLNFMSHIHRLYFPFICLFSSSFSFCLAFSEESSFSNPHTPSCNPCNHVSFPFIPPLHLHSTVPNARSLHTFTHSPYSPLPISFESFDRGDIINDQCNIPAKSESFWSGNESTSCRKQDNITESIHSYTHTHTAAPQKFRIQNQIQNQTKHQPDASCLMPHVQMISLMSHESIVLVFTAFYPSLPNKRPNKCPP